MIRIVMIFGMLLILTSCLEPSTQQTIKNTISNKYIYSYDKDIHVPMAAVLENPKEYEPIGDLFFDVAGTLYRVTQTDFDSYLVGDKVILTIPQWPIARSGKIMTTTQIKDTSVKQIKQVSIIDGVIKLEKTIN